MRRLLNFRKVNASVLLKSKLYDETHFYDAFTKDLKHAKQEVIIESPYLTCKRANELAPVFRKLIRKGVRVHVNTRNPNHHDKYLRIQAWIALKKLKDSGVKVRLYNDMRHRKLAILDNTILWEGSLNVLSQNNSREVMRRTESKELCRQMISFAKLKRWYW
ncbi:MAG TPA: phospholipase D-like domain-containing protein [Candidatus Saccharimonadales bacterium]|nr:phospholipase D-like domain-containing protein [Candidatus Saccharimonadales bacterium]